MPPPRPAKHRVLVVEDNPGDVFLLREMVEEFGATVERGIAGMPTAFKATLRSVETKDAAALPGLLRPLTRVAGAHLSVGSAGYGALQRRWA